MKRSLYLFAILGLFSAAQARAEDEGVEPIDEVFEPAGRFDAATQVKVAVLQWNDHGASPLTESKTVAEAYKQRNREQMESYIRQAAAKGAEIVVTPEFGVVNYPDIPELPSADDNWRTRDDIRAYVEPAADGASTKFFSRLAKELKIYIHYGFAEVEVESDRYYNAVGVVDPTGALVAIHRKVNLYQSEGDYISSGEDLGIYEGPAGKTGLLICADVYDSRVLAQYRREGVKVLALSTSWAQYNTGMGYFRRAAQTVGSYLLAANQTYFPDSGVVNPNGQNQTHIRQSEGLAYGYLPRVNASPRRR
jgi:predicted amidohydrolase